MCSERLSRYSRLLLPLFLIVLSGACSIKEDREDCPCWLTFDFSGINAGELKDYCQARLYWSVLWDDGGDSGDLPCDSGLESMVVPVPRTHVSFALSCSPLSDGTHFPGLVIPEGSDCPVLYSFAGTVDARMEECLVPVVLHKNYCVMDISLRDLYMDGAEYVLRGDVAGYDESWRPVFGTFSFILSPDSDGYCCASLPRQIDNSLKLCVFRYGELERIFALGEYVAESGYDWDAIDLEDISLEIDYSHSSASFKIDQWKKTLTFTVVI